MERAYMPPAEPPPLEHDTWGAPHPKAAVAGPPARTAGFHPSLPFAKVVVKSNLGSISRAGDDAPLGRVNPQHRTLKRAAARGCSGEEFRMPARRSYLWAV